MCVCDNATEKRDTEDWRRARDHAAPEAEREYGSQEELSREGRQPRPLALVPLARKKQHTHTRELGDGAARRPAREFPVTSFIHFPFMLHGGLEERGMAGFKRRRFQLPSVL